jgi:hypothetical protein
MTSTLRFRAVDMVRKAGSGRPALPLVSASMAYALCQGVRTALICSRTFVWVITWISSSSQPAPKCI